MTIEEIETTLRAALLAVAADRHGAAGAFALDAASVAWTRGEGEVAVRLTLADGAAVKAACLARQARHARDWLPPYTVERPKAPPPAPLAHAPTLPPPPDEPPPVLAMPALDPLPDAAPRRSRR